MPIKYIEDEFTPAANASVTGVRASHHVSRGTLRGSVTTWIKKEMPDPAVAKIERLAQEFFRLIIPHQGETRLLVDKTTRCHYILSEEVKGYRNLPRGEAANFSNGRYTGLGQVVVGSMFLEEIDLKNGNVGLDDQGRVAKIDGDWCFAEREFGDKKYDVTPAAIAGLPYPTDFYMFNWLDLVMEGTARAQSDIVSPELTHSAQFRAEVNEAMLKICLIPDGFIERFVDAYMPAGAGRFIDLIKSRKELLMNSAIQNKSFQDYVASDSATEVTQCFIRHMTLFQASGERRVLPIGDHFVTGSVVTERLATLRTLARSVSTIVVENNRLLEEILLHKINNNDVVLQKYVDAAYRNIKANYSNPERLAAIRIELTTTLQRVASSQVKAVIEAAQALRSGARWNTIGKAKKADLIEAALCNTPIEQRGTVITAPINLVQEALASHRHLGKRKMVYKTEHNEIDVKRAAQAFKTLKDKFSDVSDGSPPSEEEGVVPRRR